MQDGIIDIVNRVYCYDEFCEPIALKYRRCIFSSKEKNSEMKEQCSEIKKELIQCRNRKILITYKVK